MFELYGQGGVFDSWVERWRTYRGTDLWPIVPAKVIAKTDIESGEGGYYKVSLTYRVPAVDKDDQVATVVTLSTDEGSIHSGAEVGDVIELRAHPQKTRKLYSPIHPNPPAA